MSSSVYSINKGVNQAIVFKGLKAQYIWWLGGGLVGILILFVIMHVIGINTYISLGLSLGGATAVIVYVFRLSNTYGEYGMMKKIARRSVPMVIKCNSRKVFFNAPKVIQMEK
jgi:hypothetical protein